MLKLRLLAATAAAVLMAGVHTPAKAQEFYVGQMQQFATNWCPLDWQLANGALLSIAANTALYSVIGTTYGGDGVNTFAVPDLRDRAPLGYSNVLPIGAMVGSSQRTLLITEMPAHTHQMNGDPTGPATTNPADSMLGLYPSGQMIYAAPSAPLNKVMNPRVMAPAGGSQPFNIQSPVLSTNWCIATQGIYPQLP